MNEPVSARLLGADGTPIPLPPLRSWEILRTDGDACDAITLTTAAELSAKTLSAANRVQAFYRDNLVFTGLVDECELSITEQGSALMICGRGMAARLLDNQVPEHLFRRISVRELLQRYVRPYGIEIGSSVDAFVQRFQVERGSSAMQVLKGFCAHAGLQLPMFDRSGRLLLRERLPISGIRFTQQELRSAVYRDQRYGVRSRVELRHIRTGKTQTATNPAFLERGGRSEIFTSYAGEELPAGFRTAAQRIRASKREEYTVELELPDPFPCEPGTKVELELPRFDLTGSFAVCEVRTVGDSGGCRTTVGLRRE